MSWYHHLLAQTIFAILEDTGLVILVILCSKIVGVVITWTIAAGFLHEALGVLKGFGLIVLWCWFFTQLLINLYNLSKGKFNGSHAFLVA
jgi:hypothetical protein